MLYTLMNKDNAIIDIEFDNAGGIARIADVHDLKYAPIGIGQCLSKDKIPSIYWLNKWWLNRMIPFKRVRLWGVLQRLNINYPKTLLLKSLGLSLSDQYWLKPEKSSLSWHNINFFENDFANDIGDACFDSKINDSNLSIGPNSACNGNLPKKWAIRGHKRVLVKTGLKPFYQEPFNEVIASAILNRLDFDHVNYSLSHEGKLTVSVCENFITPQTEFVTAWQVYNSVEELKGEDSFQHLKRAATILHIPGYEDFMDKMLIFDYLIDNEDRHYNNFGFIRDVETLKFVGCAPIFDNGNSLWFDASDEEIGKTFSVKPFVTSPDRQLDLVSSFAGFHLENVISGADIIKEVLSQNSSYSTERVNKIGLAFENRCKSLNARKEVTEKVVDETANLGTSFNKAYLTKGLPKYLEHDLRAYIKGLAEKSSLLDCLWSELYGSINSAEWDLEITHEQATYLREKYLYGED